MDALLCTDHTGMETNGAEDLESSDCTLDTPVGTVVLESNEAYMPLTPFLAVRGGNGLEVRLPMWNRSTVEEGLQQEQISAWVP